MTTNSSNIVNAKIERQAANLVRMAELKLVECQPYWVTQPRSILQLFGTKWWKSVAKSLWDEASQRAQRRRLWSASTRGDPKRRPNRRTERGCARSASRCV